VKSLESRQQLGSLYWTERLVSAPIKWALFIIGVALLYYWYYWRWEEIQGTAVVVLIAYASANIVFSLAFSRDTLPLPAAKVLALISYALDFLFVGYLIFGLGGSFSQLAFLMYIALIFKAGLYYPVLKESLVILPLAIILYLALLGLKEGPQIYSDDAMKPRLFLLLAIPAVTMYTARLVAGRERNLYRLNRQLEENAVELKRQAKELQAVFEGMHDGLVVSDPESNVIASNPVGRSILGRSPSAETPFSLGDSANGLVLHDIIIGALNSPEGTSRGEVQLPEPNLDEVEPRSYQAVASQIGGENGAGDQVVIILRDTTEARQLADAKSNFLSVISHELRTPLHSIKGFLDIIRSGRAGPLTETQSDFLETVSGQAEYLQVMISDLVEFSRIQVHRSELTLDLVSLPDLSRSVTNRLLPLAAEKELTIVNEVPIDLPPVEGDRMRLDQVLSNLVTNAIKFTPSGGTITLSADEMNEQTRFSVSDTGVGIPSDEQDHIFEPFYQISHGSARLYGGLGIGLSICRHLVECHGGSIWVESEEGKGSTFRFVLPSQAAAPVADERELVLQT